MLTIATLIIFAHFVACGAKMYQVSLEGDTEGPSLGYEIPQSTDQITHHPGIHSPGGWKDIPIPIKYSTELNEDQRQGIFKAINTWELTVGKKLFETVGQDHKSGDNFDDLFSSLTDKTNGFYNNDNWATTGKNSGVLATAIWNNLGHDPFTIETADLRFNTQYYIIGDSLKLSADPDKDVVDMETLALHELGHLLGLSHVQESSDPYSIMNPTMFIGEGLTSRRVSKADIELIQKIYGCEGYACNIDGLFEKLENRAQATEDQPDYAH